MEQARYQIRLYSPSTGLPLAIFDNWRSLEYTDTVNSYGAHTLSLEGLPGALPDPRFDYFTLDAIIEVWRKPYGKSWYIDYTGFHRTSQVQLSEGGHYIFTSYGRSLLDLIRRRCLLYPASTAQSIKGNPGETVIKEFVNENAGPGAASALRKHNGVTTGLTIETDLGRGAYWFGQRSWQPLLDIINEIATFSSIDFDVVKTGPLTFEFRCYYPQRGTDRTATVIFSPLFANMMAPSYTISRTEEATICVVLGQDQGVSRRTVTITDPASGDSPWNAIEMTRDARNEESYVGMVNDGTESLAEVKARPEFTFQVLQTEAMRYGVDYYVGDMITAKMFDFTQTKKITGKTIRVSEGVEEIDLEFADIP